MATSDEPEICECAMKGHHNEDTDPCDATFGVAAGELYCSRPKGHDGPHAACSVAAHPAEVWSNE